MKNEEVYIQTKAVKWSKTIRKRRLTWLEHLLRLDENTPAKIAFREACRTVTKNVGRNKMIWIG